MTAASIFDLLLEVVEREQVTIITTTHDRLVMEKAQRVVELADGKLMDGATAFERDKREAIAVPWTPPAESLPRPLEREEKEESAERWARPERPIYRPPASPHDPL